MQSIGATGRWAGWMDAADSQFPLKSAAACRRHPPPPPPAFPQGRGRQLQLRHPGRPSPGAHPADGAV